MVHVYHRRFDVPESNRKFKLHSIRKLKKAFTDEDMERTWEVSWQMDKQMDRQADRQPNVQCNNIILRPSRRGVGGTCSLVPLKYFLIFPCSPKSKSKLSMFPAPQNYLCSPIPFIFRLVFSWSPEINDITPLFSQNPWEGLNTTRF